MLTLGQHRSNGGMLSGNTYVTTWVRSSSSSPPPFGDMCHPMHLLWHRSSSPPIPHWGHLSLSIPTAYMAEILLSFPIPNYGHLSLSTPHCIHGRNPPLLSNRPLGTCVTEHSPSCTFQRSSSPHPIPH